MELLKAVILGIVQGLTEFLPISSSGHLVIGSQILDFQKQGIAFDVFLHLGTLLSVVIVFRQDIWAMALAPIQYAKGVRTKEVRNNLKWDLYIIIATIPAVIAGLYLKDHIEVIFTNLPLVFVMLSITGVIMISSRYLGDRNVELRGPQALMIGCAQAMAIMPGLSRSGSTIFAGMAMGIERQLVARFSFIMSIPAILGAVVLQLGELAEHPPSSESILNIGLGTAAAALSGYFAIVLLLDLVRKNRLQWFGYYCLILSFSGITYILIA